MLGWRAYSMFVVTKQQKWLTILLLCRLTLYQLLGLRTTASSVRGLMNESVQCFGTILPSD